MYFVCESFVASVKEPLFAFMTSITQKDNSVVGHNRTDAFGDWNVDLFIFLDGHSADNEHVDGHLDIKAIHCELEKTPCKSTQRDGSSEEGADRKAEIISSSDLSVNLRASDDKVEESWGDGTQN
ncbi:uncharacterized protein MONOS_15272 [Monocercomonoides exilis]|uniref:uncharacterized protein n=1 Tax=Monocercomonoides exilis TaxID=2049356 RepID=UPI0035595932|nr:hypothetical protein MONOS_15272 [Monocercomonoides exilis]|eukprot:MONOS_15272.1-p1 / transcript=MONOS_15272.1 / gene=MONOS_15272 / organism=Monocercomonoides_exilis_PA203 / gene_product=unspecified product / transcript_product=unspecified product / location=Mono_scaffold01187:1262-1636(+) / protein_length=125 / sequence_SO=supercontig / SO=protein_coding / is_pseudo=false